MSKKITAGLITSTAITSAQSGVWSTDEAMVLCSALKWSGQSLYTFTDATIYPNISGANGPSLVQVVAGTTSTGDVSWKNNSSYFNVTSGIISWKVPATGTYRIEVWGARGGDATGNQYWGGYGARMRGDFVLTVGDIIKILVGQSGGSSYGGGGGGTFVATNTNSPLIVAGGGNTLSAWSYVAVNASTGTSGVNGSYAGAGSGGSGGTATGTSACGGAGFTGNGGAAGCASEVVPKSFINGGAGGTTCNSIGGFGGGSASDGCCMGASGAGGGYSGGAGCSTSSQYGGAGGSYNSGTNQSNDNGGVGTATLAGNGKVIITKL